MSFKAAVFAHNALGDGVNSLVLSNLLHINGFQVDTYQNTIGGMQNWFPHLPIFPYPKLDQLSKVLQGYDWYFVVWNDSSEFVLKLIEEGKRRFPEKMKVIYLYPSPRIVNEPYYSDCLTDPSASVAENMRGIASKIMHLPKKAQGNGLIVPQGLHHRKHAKRVVIHPTSGRLSRNWPKERYVKLALHLQEEGFEPVFVPGSKEIAEWHGTGVATAEFPDLDGLARFLYEASFLIGNDSGVGHLASSLGIPTLTVCRRKALAKLWAPSFTRGIVVTPSSWIPNIRGLRWRDRYWRHLVTVNAVRRGFERLLGEG
jgi:heptosyltransferase-3